jgi:cytochrome P450
MRSPLPAGPRAPPLLQAARWGLRPREFLEACRERYGETFTCRFTGLGESVFFSHPDAAAALFATSFEDAWAGKTKFVRPILGPSSVLCIDGPEHLRQRRLLLPPFHGERVAAMRSLVAELADRELSTWRRGSAVRTWERMQQVTLDAVLVAVFGVSERSPLRPLLLELNRLARSPLQLARLSVLRRDLAAPPHPRSRLGRLLGRIDRELYARIGRAGDGPDVLSMLAASEMTPRELRDELLTMLLAGWETTSASLAWAFERLSRNPDAWRSPVPAIVQETLRTRPVLWLAGRTLLRPLSFGGVELPAGTLAYACSYLTHTRADLWPDPYRFDPSRFVNGKPQTFTWIPFGGGRRRCIGAAFAALEMEAVLERAKALSFEPVGDPERFVRRGMIVAPGRGGVVRVV